MQLILPQESSINLLTNHEDAIASIANYLYKSHWQSGKPVAIEAKSKLPLSAQWIKDHSKNSLTVSQWQKYGFKLQNPADANLQASLLTLDTPYGHEYWLLFSNFKSILSYNHSTNYALAVYLLGHAVREMYERNTA